MRRLELVIAACLYYSGLVGLARWFTQRSQRLVILCYHHAGGGDLRQHLLYLNRHYRILHLDTALAELYAPPQEDTRRKAQRPMLALTFDDGYYDNYTHAFPLANELQIPITIFLVPDYIESGAHFWWQISDYLITHAQQKVATIAGITYHLEKVDERTALIKAIDTQARHATSVMQREEFLTSVREVLEAPLQNMTREKANTALTWAEVQIMEESGWVSFGAHTVHHPTLACLLDITELQYEVRECRTILEKHLQHPIRSFAYPIGLREHIGKQGVHAVQEAEYIWAVTAIPGFNTAQTPPHQLRRVVVDVDQHWLMVAAKASGVWGLFSRLHWLTITFIRTLLRYSSKRPIQ